MNNQHYNVVGVMSGTSLDAIDFAHVNFIKNDRWEYELTHVASVPYSQEWKNRLAQAFHLPTHQLEEFNQEYTAYLSQELNKFIEDNKINNLAAVCSHGHTIFHEPKKGMTLQIGNLKELATYTGHRVVCDFRVQDVQFHGQGAPLVPIGDQLLFSEYDYCLNLGGFANISYEFSGKRTAFDICPVNVVLNNYAMQLGKEFDRGGAFAKAGKIKPLVLQKLNQLPYYTLKHPKSLGIEWVNENIWHILKEVDNEYDKLATFTEHIAIQIAKQINKSSRVLVTGGGAYNEFLITLIRTYSQAEIIVPDPKLVEYKEALVFALLGVLRLRNENNCLSSVTGAIKDHCSGKIYLP